MDWIALGHCTPRISHGHVDWLMSSQIHPLNCMSTTLHPYSSPAKDHPQITYLTIIRVKKDIIALWFSSSLQIRLHSALHNETTHAHSEVKMQEATRQIDCRIFPHPRPNVPISPNLHNTYLKYHCVWLITLAKAERATEVAGEFWGLFEAGKDGLIDGLLVCCAAGGWLLLLF